MIDTDTPPPPRRTYGRDADNPASRDADEARGLRRDTPYRDRCDWENLTKEDWRD